MKNSDKMRKDIVVYGGSGGVEIEVLADADTVTRQVEYYDLDMILSVGYRVKSSQGIMFRRWANGILKAQLMRRATDS